MTRLLGGIYLISPSKKVQLVIVCYNSTSFNLDQRMAHFFVDCQICLTFAVFFNVVHFC